MRATVVLAVLAAGCLSKDTDPVKMMTDDVARLCVFARDPISPMPGPQAYTDGAPVFVQVELAVCLSSSCDSDASASCSVIRTGAAFDVSTVGTWTSLANSQRACTADCGQLTATCMTEPLTAGTYTFGVAGQTVNLSVPSQLTVPPCLTF